MGEGASQALVQSLIDVVNDIAGTGEFRKIHKKECANLARRVKLLAPLFEEVKEYKGSLPEKVNDCFNALLKALNCAKQVLQLCHDGSKLFLILEMESVASKFQEVTAQLGRALDGLPYDVLDISDEVREQVELVHTQLKRAKGRIDVQDVQLFVDIESVLSIEGGGEPERAVVERLADKLELKTMSAISQELKALQSVEKGEDSHQSLDSMFYTLKHLTAVAEQDVPRSTTGEKDDLGTGNRSVGDPAAATADQYSSTEIPADFRCPISLELMKDPVILASGQTYERAYIQKWLDDGNGTCPITRDPLLHYSLTPNYVLRSLIAQWCETQGIEVPERHTNRAGRCSSPLSEADAKDIEDVELLLQKLISGHADEQRAAAGELRLRAKRSVENRICIAKAGAIPLLVNLLRNPDLKTQEHAVTALLNLSINDVNKGSIVFAGAINPIVEVLKSGSMEARENAAATLFSLSVVDENKVAIGNSGAIPALVDLLKDGTPRGKKDAATALFTLAIYQGNKSKAVRAGVVPPLMKLLLDQNAGMVDEALAILAILATHHDGRVAIGQASAIPSLVELIRSGSPRNKENAAAVLLALSISDPINVSIARQLGAYSLLAELSQTGTERAKRKSTQLLEYMKNLSLEGHMKNLSVDGQPGVGII